MLSKLPRLILTVSVLCPSLSWAVGLGEIHLNSALNEPLNAEIALVSATPEELTSLRAVLASRDTFTRYGIDRPPFLSTIAFKVGKGNDGRDALLVRSNDAIPEPFVTFLVEVNWARGRLVREYTVLLDPPVYAPGETRASAPAVAAPVAAATESSKSGSIQRDAPSAPAEVATAAGTAPSAAPGDTYQVRGGDTLMKVARSLGAGSGAQLDQTMIALYRGNPQAFDGNINVLRRGAVLRVPGAEEIAALKQSEAVSEVRRQMSAWQGSRPAGGEGRLRLVTPSGNGSGSATGDTGAAGSEAAALKGRVKDLESQLVESRRLLDIRNAELAALQKKLGAAQGVPVAPVSKPAEPAASPPAATAEPATPASAGQMPAAEPAPAPAEKPAAASPAPKPAAAPVAAEPSGSWLDWITENWWMPAALVVALLGGLGFAAWKRRQGSSDIEFGGLVDTDVADSRDSTSKLLGVRRGEESFVVEESGQHERPDIRAMSGGAAESAATKSREGKASDDTLSSEAAINLDQGDPLAEADFHMAYGLYDQAADLVRIALEREPDRRDLQLKLLEIYFVWGNKDLFLQSANDLYASRDRAPAGEWDKILIMGKQICPDEPLFSKSIGGGMGAGALVDLNLEGGENRVDIDLFGEPDAEPSGIPQPEVAHESSSTAATGEAPAFPSSDLDYVLDAPERGSEESPTREMPARDEPTVESEAMGFDASNSPTAAWETAEIRNRIESRMPQGTEQTAELAIDDLGLDLDALEQTGAPSMSSLEQTDSPSVSMEKSALDVTDHPSDAPTMVAGLDEHSRKMMQDAENAVRDRDLTELERELEASFIADLEQSTAGAHTAVIAPESAPTVQMPRELPRELDVAATSRVKTPDFSQSGHLDTESTSRLKALSPDASIDLDLDRLANAFSGTSETVDQPRAAEEVFSSEVFETTDRQKSVDLDVGEPVNSGEGVTTRVQANSQAETNKLKTFEGDLPELEPVTMSEVGTKLDLARAYMDMGDPEGARSILEEVAHEGSASQKQEAKRLIESLPG